MNRKNKIIFMITGLLSIMISASKDDPDNAPQTPRTPRTKEPSSPSREMVHTPPTTPQHSQSQNFLGGPSASTGFSTPRSKENRHLEFLDSPQTPPCTGGASSSNQAPSSSSCAANISFTPPWAAKRPITPSAPRKSREDRQIKIFTDLLNSLEALQDIIKKISDDVTIREQVALCRKLRYDLKHFIDQFVQFNLTNQINQNQLNELRRLYQLIQNAIETNLYTDDAQEQIQALIQQISNNPILSRYLSAIRRAENNGTQIEDHLPLILDALEQAAAVPELPAPFPEWAADHLRLMRDALEQPAAVPELPAPFPGWAALPAAMPFAPALPLFGAHAAPAALTAAPAADPINDNAMSEVSLPDADQNVTNTEDSDVSTTAGSRPSTPDSSSSSS